MLMVYVISTKGSGQHEYVSDVRLAGTLTSSHSPFDVNADKSAVSDFRSTVRLTWREKMN